jgi:hypothetical protein
MPEMLVQPCAIFVGCGMVKDMSRMGRTLKLPTSATIWATIWADEAIRTVYDLFPAFLICFPAYDWFWFVMTT